MKRIRDLGVTQLEVLFSLAVMGLIAVGLSQALSFQLRASNYGLGVERGDTELLAQHDLRQLIESIPLDFDDQTARHIFAGNSQSINFMALDSDASASGDASIAARYQLALNAKAELRLSKIQNAQPTSPGGRPGPSDQIIASEVSALEISYYGRITNEVEAKWHPSWSDPIQFPDLIKLEWLKAGVVKPPLTIVPARIGHQSEISLSSLVPPE